MSETHHVSDELLARLRRFMPREARWAYWQDGSGPMFVYNTERIHSRFADDVANGKFESCIFEPYGRGSRSGKAKTWRKRKDSSSLHELRRDAKARALRLYQHWRETGELDV